MQDIVRADTRTGKDITFIIISSNNMQHHIRQKKRTSYTFSHLFTTSYMPRWGVLLVDIFLCIVAYIISYAMGTNLFHYGLEMVLPVWDQMGILLILQLFFFVLLQTYAGILRYSTFIDTLRILMAVVLAGVGNLLINALLSYYTGQKLLLNTIPLLYIFVAFLLLFCLRVGVKTLYEIIAKNSSTKVLIYGTQSAGIAIAKMLRSSGDTHYQPVGFIEDDKNKNAHTLLGMNIYHLDEKLIKRMESKNIRDVIVSPLKMKQLVPSRDLAIFLNHNIRILTAPNISKWHEENDDENRYSKRRIAIDAIQIEDLLERPEININTDNVRNTLKDKTVMVTGAAGSIGSELVRQIISFSPYSVILLEQAESPLHDLMMDLRHRYPKQQLIACIADVRDRERIENVVKNFRPDIIYHAAAYKHVPLMEDHPNEAIRTNVAGTKNIADMAVKYGVERFVMISTDKAVNPTNIMGASKRIAEIYVQSLFKHLVKENPDCTKFITTRFGNVLGSNGSVIPYFKKQIAEGGPVTVTHPDIIRYFMTIAEACCLVLEAGTLGNGGEIFVFDMGHPVKILDLAKNMIRLAGYMPGEDIQIVFTGLRPGEKLYEELLNKKETTLPTVNPKIMIAKVREFPFDEIEKEINTLIATSHEEKPFITVSQMKHIVPEYISQNSIYEQLDTTYAKERKN